MQKKEIHNVKFMRTDEGAQFLGDYKWVNQESPTNKLSHILNINEVDGYFSVDGFCTEYEKLKIHTEFYENVEDAVKDAIEQIDNFWNNL